MVAKQGARTARRVMRAMWHDVRGNWLGQLLPLKPIALNLLVNDICNSRCQMCQIWRRKRDREFTPQELAQILRDPLFDRLRYVGVSGGEPTLRNDLPQIYQVLAQKTPRLRGTGVITNAIRATDVIDRVLASARVCEEAGLRFNIMVSLDGLGTVHDRVRGHPGNFDSALQVLRFFRDETDIPVRFGCTITQDNVWHLDELLDFARAEGLHGRFRVAEFIDRLYNQAQTEVIRNFSPTERYHLGLFFFKLERTYEQAPSVKRTYRNIRTMLMDDAKRSIDCPYQTEAVVLDCRGQILYCSPKSPVLGSALERSAERLYHDHIELRRRILASHCQNCIHDYHAAETTKAVFRQVDGWLWRRRLNNRSALRSLRVSGNPKPAAPSSKLVRHALVIGWYGTETAGDKAILGEILHRLRERGTEKVTIASLYPFYTRWTLKELGHEGAEVISTYSGDFLRAAAVADETIMGGGPLMDMPALGFVLHAFVQAKKASKQTRIAGCGIGPLRQPQHIETVRHIISLADMVELRDSSSVEWAVQATGRTDVKNSGDLAIGFVHRWMDPLSEPISRQATLNCYLREWPVNYRGELSQAEFHQLRPRFEEQLGKLVSSLCDRLSLRPRLLAMHHFVVGNDDRDFNRRFAGQHIGHLDPIVEECPFSVHDILQSMQQARMCLTMRFHSTLFAQTLNVPYIALDYTRGGKVLGFLEDCGATEKLLTVDEVADRQWPFFVKALDSDEHLAD
mgnify:CR=1 FL=1